MELAPEGVIWRWHWGYLLALLGRTAEAAAEADRMLQADAASPYTQQLVAMTRALTGDTTAAYAALTGQPSRGAARPMSPHASHYHPKGALP